MSDTFAVPTVFATDKLRQATQKLVEELAGTDPNTVGSVVEAMNAADACDGRKDFFSSKDLTELMSAHDAYIGERNAQAKTGPAGQLFAVRFNLRQALQERDKLAAIDPDKALASNEKVQELQSAAAELVGRIGELVAARAELKVELAELDKEAQGKGTGKAKAGREGDQTRRAEIEATLAALDAAGVPDQAPEFTADPARFNPYVDLAAFVADRVAKAGSAPAEINLAELFAHATAAEVVEKPTLAPLVETIAGKSIEARAAEIEGVLEQSGVYGLLYDPNKIRVTPAQDVVERLESIPVIANFIIPQVKEMLKGWEMEHRAQQAQTARATLLVKTEKKGRPEQPTPAELWTPKLDKLYEATQEVARSMGFTEEVVVVHEDAAGPNAYVYTFDTSEPRVTYMRPLVDRCWDHEKNDWVTLWKDKDGKVVPEGTAGAIAVPEGKHTLQSVTGHELGHIRDGVMVYQTTLQVLMLMMGVDLTVPPQVGKDHVHDSACGCQLMQSKAVKDIAQKLIDKIGLKPHVIRRLLEDALSGVAPDLADAPPEQMGKRLGFDAAVIDKCKELAGRASHEGEDSGQLANFMLRLMFLSQNFETTADRHAIIRDGRPGPTQLMDYMLNTHAFNTQESSTEIISGMIDKAEAWARHKLEAGAGYRSDMVQRTGFGLSHPPGPVRVLNAGEYAAKDEFFAAVQAVKGLPADQKLLAMVQIAEKAIEVEKIKAEALDPHDALDTNGAHAEVASCLKRAKALEEQFAPLFDYVVELVRQEGKDAPAGAFIDHLLAYAEAGGSDFTADKADAGAMGGMMSLMALMGGGAGGGEADGPKQDGRGQFDTLMSHLAPLFAGEGDGLQGQRFARISKLCNGADTALAGQIASTRQARNEMRQEAKRRAALRSAAA